MKTSNIVGILTAILLATGCMFVTVSGPGKAGKNDGNGIVVEKDFGICDFARIKLDVPAEVTYTVADNPSMIVRLDENLMDDLSVSVKDGTLKIGSSRPLRNYKELSVLLSSTALLELDCSGAVDFVSHGPLRGDIFTLKTRGATHADIDSMAVRFTRMTVNGAGDINVHFVDAPHVNLSGFSLKVNGTGKVNLSSSYKVDYATVKIKGTGTVDLTGLDYKGLDMNDIGRGTVNNGNRPVDNTDPSQSEENFNE